MNSNETRFVKQDSGIWFDSNWFLSKNTKIFSKYHIIYSKDFPYFGKHNGTFVIRNDKKVCYKQLKPHLL